MGQCLSFVFFIWPLYCLLWVIVCPLSFSFDHCIVCYGSLFVLFLFHLTIVLSVMGHCLSFFVFIWPLYCLLWVIVCPLSFLFEHCIFCYGSLFVLFLFHLTIVLSVMGQCLSFVFFIWPLYCLLLVIVCPLYFSFDHCIVCYGSLFVLCLFHFTIVLSVMGHCLSFVFFIWPLYCLLWVNVCPLPFSFDHCIVYYGSLFVLCLFHLTIVLSVMGQCLSFVFFIWQLYCLLWVNVCPLSFSFDHCIVCYGSLFVLCLFHLTIVLSVMGHCLSFFFFIWPLYCLLWVNVCPLSFSFDHCIVCYGSLFVLCLFHLTIVLSVMGQCLSFVFFIWSFYCLLWVIVFLCLVHMSIVLSVMGHCLSFAFFIWPLYCLLWVIVCPLSFSFDHCIVCYGSMFVLCLFHFTFVLSVMGQCLSFVFFIWPLYCLLWVNVCPLSFSFDHCIVCNGSMFVLCLFHLTIVLSVMGHCLSFVFFIWPLYCLLWVIVCPFSFSFDHCIVCYGSLFVLFRFHLTIVLSVMGHCLSFVFFIWTLYFLLWVIVCPFSFSFDHCIVCYGSMFVLCNFHLTIVLSFIGHCLSFVFFIWSLYCLLWVIVCPLPFSFYHCIVCYGSLFVLCLFHLTIVLSVMGQCLSFAFFIWPLYCLLWVIVCPLSFSFDHCIVCYGSMFVLCLCHLTIVLSAMGHCLSFVFFIWPLYCLLWVIVCPLSFSFDHCIVCYGSMFVLCIFHLIIVLSVMGHCFSLSCSYVHCIVCYGSLFVLCLFHFTIVLSVMGHCLSFFVFIWPLYCLLWVIVCPLSFLFEHCIFCYGSLFVLFLFHLTIVLSVMGQCLSFVFFIWPLYCLLLVIVCPLYFSFDHCIVCYGSLFVLCLFHFTIVLSVMGHCLSFVFFIWPLYCLLWVNVCPLPFSFDHCIVYYGSLFVLCLFHLTIVLSVMGQCLSFVFFIWQLYCLLWVNVCPLSFSFDHCIVCYGSLFVLCLFHLTIVLSVMGHCLSFFFFIWPLYCLLWVNVCPLSFSFDHCIVCYGSLFVLCLFHLTIVLSVMGQCLSFVFFIWSFYCLLWVIVCPLYFSFDHCIVCYGSLFVLCLFHFTIVLSVMGHCLSFVFFIWPLYCLLWVNVCPLPFSFDHCIVYYGSLFVLCLFHLTIVLSVMGQCLSFVFFIWQLYCLLWVNVCPLSFSFDHCIVCYGSLFVLCLFHLTIVLSVMGHCLSFFFFIWPLYCLLWVNVCPLSFSFDHCIVCYGSLFVLCLFHLTIVLSVMGQCLSFVFFIWPLYCLLWVIVCPLPFSFDHCIVCYGSMFVLCLFHFTFVLSVMGQCLSFVFFIWPLYCLLWVNVCPLSFSFDHCIVCNGSMFVLCLFHLTIVLSVMGHCLSFVFFIWPLYCLLWVIVCPFSFSFDHCIVCYGSLFVLFRFHLTIVLSVMGHCLSFVFFIWTLYFLLWVIVCPFSFSFDHCIVCYGSMFVLCIFHLTIVLSFIGHCLSFVFFIWSLYCLLWVIVCPLPFSFYHCIVCYGSLFVLCLFHLTIVLSVMGQCLSFAFFIWPLYCLLWVIVCALSFSFDHCIVCYGSMFVLCLFHLTIVLSVMGQCLSFVFFIWPLYCLLWVIVCPLSFSFDHCIVCYGSLFVLFLFHLTIVLSVMGQCLSFVFFIWPLYCLLWVIVCPLPFSFDNCIVCYGSMFVLCIFHLIILLSVMGHCFSLSCSYVHCIVCYGSLFVLCLFHLTIVLSVMGHCLSFVFFIWPLYCLLWVNVCPLSFSFYLCIVCNGSMFVLCLFHLTIVLSVMGQCLSIVFFIWPLYCL